MATELIERMVIRHFEEAAADYEVVKDDLVKIRLPSEALGSYTVGIADLEISGGADMLSAQAVNIAQFPLERIPRALAVCNDVNEVAVGKFVVGEDGFISYGLDWPVAAGAEPDDISLMLSFVSIMIERHYPTIMSARWGDSASPQASERGRGGDESGEPPPLSDDEIAKLLEMLEAEDGEEGS